MKFATLRDLRNSPGDLLDQCQQDEVVITQHGRPAAILIRVAPDDVEATVRSLREARFLRTLAQAHEEARLAGTDQLTDAEIDAEIDAVRRERRAAGRA